MKKVLITIFSIICVIAIFFSLCVCFTGCTEAGKVNYNITKEAENFNVRRRVTVINCIKGDVLFTVDGLMNIEADTTDNQLELIVQIDEGVFEKHFIGLSDNVTYTVQDISGGTETNKYKFEIHYNPNMWFPYTTKNSD